MRILGVTGCIGLEVEWLVSNIFSYMSLNDILTIPKILHV
jgi:hypothetical protein